MVSKAWNIILTCIFFKSQNTWNCGLTNGDYFYFFSISIMFTNLQLSRLGIENLDHLILIIKKWASNACVHVKLTNIFEFLVSKECRDWKTQEVNWQKRFVWRTFKINTFYAKNQYILIFLCICLDPSFCFLLMWAFVFCLQC